VRQSVEYQTCEKYLQCLTCPVHGSCDDEGHLSCNTGYIRNENRCIENEQLKVQAIHILNNFQEKLRDLHGAYACGESETPYVTFPELQSILENGYTGQIAPLLAKIVTLLNNKDTFGGWDIHWSSTQDAGTVKKQDFAISLD